MKRNPSLMIAAAASILVFTIIWAKPFGVFAASQPFNYDPNLVNYPIFDMVEAGTDSNSVTLLVNAKSPVAGWTYEFDVVVPTGSGLNWSAKEGTQNYPVLWIDPKDPNDPRCVSRHG